MPENSKAQLELAYCPRCGRFDVTTRWEGGVRKYEPHPTIRGGSVNCFKGSNQPVDSPRGER